jgi:hypothetical protein
LGNSLEWELKFVTTGNKDLQELNTLLRQAGVNLDEVRAKAKESREYDKLVADLKRAGIQVKSLADQERDEAKAAHASKEEHSDFFGKMFEAEVLSHMFERLTEAVKDYAEELIKSAAEASDMDFATKTALTHLTGSVEVAEDVMEHARAFANGTAEDIDKVYQIFQRLAATGLRGNQLTAAADAAKDLSAVTGRSFDQTAELFELIGSDRGLGGRAVRQMAQFPGLLNELEKHFGFVPGTAKSFEELSKQLTEAPIKGAQGLALLEDMIAKVAHEDQLGDVGVKMSETFEGSLTKMRNDFKEILGGLSEEPLFETMRKDFAQLADYFDPANEGGKALAETLRSIEKPIAEVIGLLASNPDVIAGVFQAAVLPAKLLALEFEGLFVVIKEIEHAAAYLGALFETHSFKKAHDIVYEAESEQEQKASNEQRDARDRGLSPAERKEMAETLALPTPGPHVLPPLEPIPGAASGTSVDEPTLMWVGEGGETEHVIPDSKMGGGGGGAPTVNISVKVDGGGKMTEQDLAAKLAELVPAALMNAFEQIAQQKGGG